VLLRVQVGADGLPRHIEIRTSSGSGRLDEAALEAVRRWKFVPARRGDEAVEAWVLVPVAFSLGH
jgi:protein TonB